MEAPEKIVDLDNFVITASEASSFKLWPDGPLAPSPEPNSIQMLYIYTAMFPDYTKMHKGAVICLDFCVKKCFKSSLGTC